MRAALAAEVRRGATTPPIVATALGTVAASTALSHLVGFAAYQYVQVGLIALGAQTANFTTSAALAVPRRATLYAAQAMATLTAATLTAAAVALTLDEAPVPPRLAAAGVALVLASYLAHTTSHLTANPATATGIMVTIVVVLGPLARQLTDTARYLPGEATSALLDPTGAILEPLTTLTLWILAASALGVHATRTRDL